jgi:hypothetical protein
MTPEERNLINRVVSLAEENNKLLRAMRRSARIASFMRALYWLIILASIFGTYYFIEPYIDAITESYAGMKDNIANVKGLTDKLPDVLNLLGGKQ